MGKRLNKDLFVPIIPLFLLLFTGFLRADISGSELMRSFRFNIIFIIYIGMLLAWDISIRRRIVRQRIKFYLLAIISTMIFWVLIRSCKHRFFADNGVLERFFWYCYFIPIVLLPLFNLSVAIYVGKPEKWKMSKGYYVLHILSLILILLALTNDHHQWLYVFQDHFSNWGRAYYYGPLFFIISFLTLSFALATVGILFHHSQLSESRKLIWIPLSFVLLDVLYVIFYIFGDPKIFRFIESTVMHCFINIAFWEAVIRIGLLPTNQKYLSFFYTSSLEAQIISNQGEIRYISNLATPISKLDFSQLKRKGMIYPDKDSRLCLSSIHGGYVIWKEDTSEINGLIHQWRESNAQLQDESELIRREITTQSKLHMIREQNRIYQLISEDIKPQLQKIEKILKNSENPPNKFSSSPLQDIVLLASYIKRKSNLILMIEGKETITSEELHRCLQESLAALKMKGVEGGNLTLYLGEMNPEHILFLYSFFHHIVENTLGILETIYIILREDGTHLLFNIQMTLSNRPPHLYERSFLQKAKALDGEIVYEQSEDIHHITVRLEGR